MLMSALVFAPTFSNAQIVDNENKGTLNATVDLKASSNTSSGSSTIDVDTDSDVDVETEDEGNATTSNSSDTDSEVSLKVNASGVAVVTASQVNSDSDLEIFRTNISSKEEMVDEVKIESKSEGESKIEVVYKHYGKLFGVMPVVMKSYTTVETKADGEVKVKSSLPWWSFLVTETNYAQTEIESKIKENSKIKASANVQITAEAKAEIVEAVIAELNAQATTRASINQ